MASAIAVAVAACICASSCNDPNKAVVEKKALSSVDQKTKLVEIAQSTLDVFDAEDYRAASELINWFSDEYLDKEYDFQEVEGFTTSTVNGGAGMLALTDFNATFRADEDNLKWKLESTGGSATVFKFKNQAGKDASLTLKANGDVASVQISKSEEEDGQGLTVSIPASVNFELKDNKSSVKGNLGLTYKSNKSLEVNLSANVAGTLNVKSNFAVTPAALSGDFSITEGGVDVIQGEFTSNLGLPVKKDSESQEVYVKRLQDYCNSYYPVFNAEADLRHQAQLKLRYDTYLFNAIDYLYDTDDSDNQQQFCLKLANVYNEYLDIDLYYGGSVLQASIIHKPFYDSEDDYWYVTQVLYFPADDTTYDMDDYFDDEEAFGGLIQNAQAVLDSFISLFVAIESL